MTKEKEVIKENWKIMKWMYVKESQWLPVIYTPLQDLDAFCSIYCKGKDWIPLILETMIQELEKEYFKQYEDNGKDLSELSEKEVLETKIKAWRQAQKIWNFFWQSAKSVTDKRRSPFVIKIRHMTNKE